MGKAQCCQVSADCIKSSDENTQHGRRSQHMLKHKLRQHISFNLTPGSSYLRMTFDEII